MAQRHLGSVGIGAQAARTDPRHHLQRRRAAKAGGAGLPARRTRRSAQIQHRRYSRCGQRRMIGKLLRNVRAGEHRSPLAGSDFAAPDDITVTSTAFSAGGAMPMASAGQGVGDNPSPQLSWAGLPPQTRQVVLIIDDVDVPLPRPLLHTVAVIEPTLDRVAAGALQPGTAGIRFIRGDLGHRGYAGPRPIPGHGPHHYRFHVFAIDQPVADSVTSSKALLAAMAGHVLARGTLTGTYER